MNWDNGSYQTLTTSGSVTLGFTNFPASGVAASIVLQITVASTAHTLTLPAAVSIGTANLQGYASNVITFSTTGTFVFEFTTVNGGSAISVVDLIRNRDPIYLPSSEDLAASAGASLNVTTSYFSTSAAETATLATGATGQIKVFAMYADSGDMVITVSNAGWKSSGSGTIAFNSTGDSCTLQYIQGKWYVIGNNSCVIEGLQPAEVVSAPSTASSTGLAGQIAYDSSFIYVCISANTWKRASIASW